MTTQMLLTVKAKHGSSRRCDRCGAIVSWRQTRDGRWLLFESDPVALRTLRDHLSGTLYEQVDAAELHAPACGQGAA